MERRYPLLSYSNECLDISRIEAKGYTTKDCSVTYNLSNSDGVPEFSFYCKGEDFYYGEHGMEYDDWHDFIPPCFSERCENSYEIYSPLLEDSSNEELLEFGMTLLKLCGYEKIEQVYYQHY